jgi:hypothetical protein
MSNFTFVDFTTLLFHYYCMYHWSVCPMKKDLYVRHCRSLPMPSLLRINWNVRIRSVTVPDGPENIPYILSSRWVYMNFIVEVQNPKTLSLVGSRCFLLWQAPGTVGWIVDRSVDWACSFDPKCWIRQTEKPGKRVAKND